jgi:hypothetical protein
MKAMRGRIVLQSTSCEITQSADLFREALGERARPRAVFFLSLRFIQSFFNFAFFPTNIFQMALEKRQLRLSRIWLVTHRLALPIFWPGLFCFADLEKQVIFLFLKLAVAGLQALGAICGVLFF